ncbi:MAG: bacillithiol biosynthesis BshC [Planctomycetes bacterium]|nr:bacillithiol biosynthesis BshC [Planctomycetota bacterium]
MKFQAKAIHAGWPKPSETARIALLEGQIHGLRVARKVQEIDPVEDLWPSDFRQALATSIEGGLSPLGIPDGVGQSLEALAQPGTLAVVTGQQPGFLCSPLYSLFKALQACKLAKELTAEWGRTVIPLFWNHADDHDIAEVHHSYIQNRNLDLQKVSLAGLSSGRQPLSTIALSEEEQGLPAIRALLQQNFGMYSHGEEAVDLFMPRDGETLPRAMTRVFLELLGPHGLVPIEPDWIRKPLGNALAQVVESGAGPALQTNRDQAAIDPMEAALLFLVGKEGRTAVRLRGDHYVVDGETTGVTPADLAKRVRANPEEWSAGALFRPLIQDLALPSVAYIGGLGELAYHAQLVPAREAAKVPKTCFVPRVSALIVDDECVASLEKGGVTVQQVLESEGQLKPNDDAPPTPQVFGDIREILKDTKSALSAQRGPLSEIDPSMDRGLMRATNQMTAGIEKLLATAERIHKNKGGKKDRHLRRLNNRLVPRGLPQERVLGPLEFYARYGPDFFEALYAVLPSMSASPIALHTSHRNAPTQ